MGFGHSKRKKHSRPGAVTLRAYPFRVEVSPSQSTGLHQTLTLAWELRNQQAVLLEENRQEEATYQTVTLVELRGLQLRLCPCCAASLKAQL